MTAPGETSARPEIIFHARISGASAVPVGDATIVVGADRVTVRRGVRVLADAPFVEVRARRTLLSIGSALRLKVGDKTFVVDFSQDRWSPIWLPLDLLLPPISFARDISAGRRAVRRLLDALGARGAST